MNDPYEFFQILLFDEIIDIRFKYGFKCFGSGSFVQIFLKKIVQRIERVINLEIKLLVRYFFLHFLNFTLSPFIV